MYIVAKSLSDPQPISLTQRAVKERVYISLGDNHRNINFSYVLIIRQYV